MRLFIYKLATYISTGDVTGLQDALFRGSCRVSRVYSGIPGSYSNGSDAPVSYRVKVSFFGCMSPVDMIFKWVFVHV